MSSDWLAARAARSPSAIGLIDPEGRQVSFAALQANAEQLAHGLGQLGVERGDRVGLLLPHGVDFVEMVHAVRGAGAVLVPLNSRLSRDELKWVVEDSDARVVVVDRTAGDTGVPVNTVAIGELKAASQKPQAPVTADPPEMHSIIYTSGTTGRPKGAMLTARNHLWSALNAALRLGWRADDRLLASLPLYHVGGLAVLLRSVIYGVPVVMPASLSSDHLNRAIEREQPTLLSLVAVMLSRLLAERGSQPLPSSVRAVLLGGGPVPLPLLDTCERLGVPALQTYGLTETASQFTTLGWADMRRKLGSAGRPLPFNRLKVGVGEGEATPGQAGEILVRGPSVSPGYWRDPAANSLAARDGWFRTGDVGYVDEEGYLYVLDRRDDLIVSGGENIYPAEVEAALLAHPAVEEAAVFRADDEVWGQVPACVVRLREGLTVTADDLIAFCRGRLAAYKAPKTVRFVDAIPRTASGKVQRHVLASPNS